MAITYEIKKDNGGFIILIPNQTGSPFGNIKIWDQDAKILYEHDFSSEANVESTLIIKIPASDIEQVWYVNEISINIDSEGENTTYTYDLSINGSKNFILNVVAGNWISFVCPITW